MQQSSKSTTIYHLEMRDPKAYCPKTGPPGFEVKIIDPPNPGLNHWLYTRVGPQWEWTDRLNWSEDDWHCYVHRQALNTYIGEFHGQLAGYFELESQPHGNVEIAYFGLLPEFIGQGLGGPLLSAAIERAWKLPDTRRVWVHTCSRDHKHALDNYLKRGFKVFKTEQK